MIFPSHDRCYRNTKAGAEISESYEMELTNLLSTRKFYSLMLAAWKQSGDLEAQRPGPTKPSQAIQPTNLNVFRNVFCDVEEKL